MSVNKIVFVCMQQSVSSLTSENCSRPGNDNRSASAHDVDYRNTG